MVGEYRASVERLAVRLLAPPPTPMMGPQMTRRALHLVVLAALLAACQPVGGGQMTAVASAAAPAAPAASAVPTERATPTTRATPSPTATPVVTAVPTPVPTVVPTPVPPPTAFAFDLYGVGDFVPQHTFEWCVGASIQMAYNLVAPDVRNSYDDQQALWQMARERSSNSFNGANPRGWAQTLSEIGLGPYELVSIPDYDEALRTAAAAIRDTGRPVGLVMWRGRHAWVMSGFESIGDPAIHADFSLTGIRVLDPLYPHGSGTWGPSPEPDALLSPADLATQFVIREPRRWSSDLQAGYLLVLPTTGT
jgi:hypothetical protein